MGGRGGRDNVSLSDRRRFAVGLGPRYVTRGHVRRGDHPSAASSSAPPPSESGVPPHTAWASPVLACGYTLRWVRLDQVVGFRYCMALCYLKGMGVPSSESSAMDALLIAAPNDGPFASR
jgi:hypothetical protein